MRPPVAMPGTLMPSFQTNIASLSGSAHFSLRLIQIEYLSKAGIIKHD